MKIPKFRENKIFFTRNVFKWVKRFSNEKDSIVITPLTRISDLLNLKTRNIMRKMLIDLINKMGENAIPLTSIENITQYVNKMLDSTVLETDLSVEKIVKSFFIINDDNEITNIFIKKYLKILNDYSEKQINVYIAGFELTDQEYSMLNIFNIVNDMKNVVSWRNIESLVILEEDDLFEVEDGEKLLSWLELKTKTVLSIKDINQYLEGVVNMNSFLIERALREIAK